MRDRAHLAGLIGIVAAVSSREREQLFGPQVAAGQRRDIVDRLFMDDPKIKRHTTHIVFNVVKVGLGVPTQHVG